jgi:phosphoribosylanthranilate isomerase
MTKVKLCGLKRQEDISAANIFKPDYIGFIFWKKSKRYVDGETALKLKSNLNKDIKAVGVFVDEEPNEIIRLLNEGVIDVVQLHGSENEKYIKHLRMETDKPIIKAFVIRDEEDVKAANESIADYVLLDAGLGEGKSFDWDLLNNVSRPYFLAGGLYPENVKDAIYRLHPYAVDVSSGIETDGHKDASKMGSFVANVRLTGQM